jgi:hypothetical protein
MQLMYSTGTKPQAQTRYNRHINILATPQIPLQHTRTGQFATHYQIISSSVVELRARQGAAAQLSLAFNST